MSDSSGTIRAGKVADLVVLDANPLQDIRNVRAVHAVVLRGALLDSAAVARIRATPLGPATR